MALKKAERHIHILPGTVTKFHEEDDDLIIEEVEDMEPLFELNAEERKATDGQRYGEFAKMAAIPPVIWQKLIKEGIAYDNERLKAWLNDPDNLPFRTRYGRV